MEVPTYGSVFMLSEQWNGREKGEKERRGGKKENKKDTAECARSKIDIC